MQNSTYLEFWFLRVLVARIIQERKKTIKKKTLSTPETHLPVCRQQDGSWAVSLKTPGHNVFQQPFCQKSEYCRDRFFCE